MVNKAIEQMLRIDYGETVWAAVRRRAGVTDEVFVSTEAYPDDLTFRLIAAASECTGTPVARILRRFGEYWMVDANGADYGHMFAAAGRTLDQFLANLPQLHDRIALQFPNLEPPRLIVTDQTGRSLRLKFSGLRPGLTAFIRGVVQGVGKRFATPVRLTVERSPADTRVLRVEW